MTEGDKETVSSIDRMYTPNEQNQDFTDIILTKSETKTNIITTTAHGINLTSRWCSFATLCSSYIKKLTPEWKGKRSGFAHRKSYMSRRSFYGVMLTSCIAFQFLRMHHLEQSSFRINFLISEISTRKATAAESESIDAVVQMEKYDDRGNEANEYLDGNSVRYRNRNDELITTGVESVDNMIETDSNYREMNDKYEEGDGTNDTSSIRTNKNPNIIEITLVKEKKTNEKLRENEKDDDNENEEAKKPRRNSVNDNHENNEVSRFREEDDEPKVDYPPSIAFLFMVGYNQTPHEDVWESWFRSSNGYHDHNDQPKKFSIFVHHNQRHPKYPPVTKTTVVNESSYFIKRLNHTEKSIKVPSPMNPFFCQYVIPSVSTTYYCCLYRGMMHLLQTAYDRDPYAKQFIFVSTTTIPLISFDELYKELIVIQQSKRYERSRFCFMDRPTDVWNYISKVLQIDLQYVSKAEMWTVLSRHDVEMLLLNRHVMDHWYYAMQRERPGTYPNLYIGAPDEMFFITMVKMIHRQAKQQLQPTYNSSQSLSPFVIIPTSMKDPTMTNFFEEHCRRPYRNLNTCCMTKVFWRPANNTISRYCRPQNPCTLSGLLYEKGLAQLQSEGFFFVRKIPQKNYGGKPIVVKTLSNETILLTEALHYLHRRQPMQSSPSSNNVENSISITDDVPTTTTSGRRLLQSDYDSTKLSLPQPHTGEHHQMTLIPPLAGSYQKKRHLRENGEEKKNDQFQCRVRPVMDVEHCWCNGYMYT